MDFISSMNQARTSVENAVKGFLELNGLGNEFEALKAAALINRLRSSGFLEQFLEYLDGLTNGVVDIVSKAKHLPLEKVHKSFEKYYYSL